MYGTESWERDWINGMTGSDLHSKCVADLGGLEPTKD